MARVTAHQVAERAGVSQSAVSRVFTPGASVSETTRKKVRAAADALGYRPNVLARSLITGKSRIIGLIVAYLDNYFYPEALEKLSNALQAEGYHVLVFMVSKTTEGVDRIMDEILDYQVDGIVVASVDLSSELTDRCRAQSVPVVLFNRTQDGAGVNTVTSDNFGGGRAVGEFLIAGGHRRIGYIAGYEGASTQRDREAGLLAALTGAGLTLHARGDGAFLQDRAREAALRMCDGPDRPDALFIANDHMAFPVMDALRADLGLDVPGDISVVGYDDVPPAAWPAYDLTTVRQRANRMVDATVKALLRQIAAPGVKPTADVIDSPLVIRGSARLPEGMERTTP
ncbi:LacI family DNA-binding transcriptional regulator [Pseudaestuariivita atlantica]|uniref:LacI family transcriptional regulator n=1 Tax=Pseudaestuariivita atlantica TaxID=1317121 RepID=A0A0L1JMB1_9RHOB|nr:LacI family DNA-binding transcriptional regulator [Pseudaestuariivita atlantica]KNG92857.1 LacI family transcriptional regulator [Pseudaestuariivita atlantica]